MRHCQHCQKAIRFVPPILSRIKGFWIHADTEVRACKLEATPIPMIDGVEHMNCRCGGC